MPHRLCLADLQSRGLRNVGTELRAEFGDVIGEDRGLMAGARYGYVTEARIQEIRMDAGVCVNEHALSGESLRAVTRDSVAVIEMSMLLGVEFDLAVVIEPHGDATIW